MTASYPLSGTFSTITVKAPAKINLLLDVGAKRTDGYHELTSVFQTIDLFDEVTLRAYPLRGRKEASSHVRALEVTGLHARSVPKDQTNLAWRAVELVLAKAQDAKAFLPPVAITIHIKKAIPTAGGMAGGSADAAAALIGANAIVAKYGGGQLSTAGLLELAAQLGSDVPFSLLGKTRLGRGRGEKLNEMLCPHTFHWVIALHRAGLKTAQVFRRFDQRAATTPSAENVDPAPLAKALLQGDPRLLAKTLHNNLMPAALSLAPQLRRTLATGAHSGALAGLVSGSGPTCLFLCTDHQHAEDVAEELIDSGNVSTAFAATAPAGAPTVVGA